MRTAYSLPYKNCPLVKRCTAPAHLSSPELHCIDFYLPPGTPILAARSGIVTETESRYNKSYSDPSFVPECNFVVIRHQDGQESVYAHLAWRSNRVKKGDRVRRGRTIGLSGQTGYATYPHLHFGVYEDERSIVPEFDAPLPPKVSWKKFSKTTRA